MVVSGSGLFWYFSIGLNYPRILLVPYRLDLQLVYCMRTRQNAHFGLFVDVEAQVLRIWKWLKVLIKKTALEVHFSP